MASFVPTLEGTLQDFKEAFVLLESQDIQVTEGIKNLIQENLSLHKESWLINSLVDYYYLTQSSSVVDLVSQVREPHDKHLLEKLLDGIKSQDHLQHALKLLLHVVCAQPIWIHKVISLSLFKVIIKCLKVETNIPVLTTAVTIVTILLPSVPTMVGPYLPEVFEIFNRLASFTIKKPPGNTPDIYYLYLQISVYALFHRLYGMFPYNFLTDLRHFYSKKENSAVFEEVIKSMLERVRLHPQLITGTKEQETSTQRWRNMETHDVVAVCSNMTLDPLEGIWEELQCPIMTSRYIIETPKSTTEHWPISSPVQAGPSAPLALPLTPNLQSATFIQQGQDINFWSPFDVIPLSTPPNSPRLTHAANVSEPSTTQAHGAAAVCTPVVTNAGQTPMNMPRETPPVSDDPEQIMGRTNVGGTSQINVDNPKRLNMELSFHHPVPLMTSSSLIQSVPQSPLRTEFTSTPPVGVTKTVPVTFAPRELQFDFESLYERPYSKEVMLVGAEMKDRDSLKSSKLLEGEKTDVRSSSVMLFEDSFKEEVSKFLESENSDFKERAKDILQGQELTSSSDLSVKDVKGKTGKSATEFNGTDQGSVKARSGSSAMDSAQMDTVSLGNISKVIDGLESQEEDSDDEVCELTSRPRSQGQSAYITAESVKKFMKSVNRIRFNSLTATQSVEHVQTRFGSQYRSRSCPQFPKMELKSQNDDDVSRSVSTICQQSSKNATILKNENSADTFATNENGNSIICTSSSVTVCTKVETTVGTYTTSDINATRSSMLTTSVGQLKRESPEHEIAMILRQVFNQPSNQICAKCKGQVESTNKALPSEPYFSSLSPMELMDRHIRLARDLHAKELSKIPIPSTQDVNWTHFGGVAPADEISIVRGQLMLLHNHLMYERNKRDQHAKRNRRLLRKIAHTKSLEEQNDAMSDQLRQHELTISDLQVSLKLLQEENFKLKSSQECEEYGKLNRLRSCLQENEDLKNAKKEMNMLLVRQREERDGLEKNLMAVQGKLFNTEHELEVMKEVTTINTRLNDQILQLHKELLLMGELQQKTTEKFQALKNEYKAYKLEQAYTQDTLEKQLHDIQQDLTRKTLQWDSCQHQLKEQAECMSKKDTNLAEFKLMLEKIKSSHFEECRSLKDKYEASRQTNQTLECYIMQLYADLELANEKLHRGKPGKPPNLNYPFDTTFSDVKTSTIQAHESSPLPGQGTQQSPGASIPVSSSDTSGTVTTSSQLKFGSNGKELHYALGAGVGRQLSKGAGVESQQSSGRQHKDESRGHSLPHSSDSPSFPRLQQDELPQVQKSCSDEEFDLVDERNDEASE